MQIYASGVITPSVFQSKVFGIPAPSCATISYCSHPCHNLILGVVISNFKTRISVYSPYVAAFLPFLSEYVNVYS